MARTAIDADNVLAVQERFSGFEDGVITGIRFHLPRTPAELRSVTFDVQAMDDHAGNAWRLVQLTVHGVHTYRLQASPSYSYDVLSDGLKMACLTDGFVLDLDPGPDPWAPDQLGREGEYGRQYAIGKHCDMAVSDGPFI